VNLKDAKDLSQSTEGLEKKVFRLLRDLKVFEDEITFVTPGHQSVGQEGERGRIQPRQVSGSIAGSG
jgi:hypothetical protein